MKPRYVFTDDDRDFVFILRHEAGIGADSIASALTTRHQQELQSKGISKITATEVSQLLEKDRAKRVGKRWTDKHLEDEEYESKFRSQLIAYGILILKGHELLKGNVSEFTQRWDDVGKARRQYKESMHRTLVTGDQNRTLTDQGDQPEQGQERSVSKEGLADREDQLKAREKELVIRGRELAFQEKELAHQERQLLYGERKRAYQDKEQTLQERKQGRKRARHSLP
ncbi:MAG: hypothetical protein LQ351_002475 [Letrouitia transgressa]|nr:MAG: hypothetical protein LQ351_002475 [Letrouitia transgressa]